MTMLAKPSRTVLILSLLALCQAASAKAQTPASAPAREDAMARMDFRQIVHDAKEKVFPAVVYIKCLRESYETGKKETYKVSGSGVILSAKGEVLTNWHVVDKAVEIRCLLSDGRAYDAKTVGTDKDTDLAVIQLAVASSDAPLPCATLGDSSRLAEGDFVMAMGAPWGLSRSVSIGIISCTRRFLPDHSEYSLWLQTDAKICPGNSGGPLVNTSGEVIGINTLGAAGDLGFANPTATVKRVYEQLRASGKMTWSWTGLQLQPLRDFERSVYFDANEGVVVSDTDPESPARRAGIISRDRIIEVAGKKVTALTEEDLPEIRTQLGLLEKHKEVDVTLVREGKTLTVKLTPRDKGKVEGEELACPRWDLTVKTINQFDNRDLYFHRQKGVFVFGIKSPGNAVTAGLQAQDIVLQIDGKEVATLEEVKAIHKKALENVNEKPRIRFTVLRNGLMRQLVLDFSRDYEKE